MTQNAAQSDQQALESIAMLGWVEIMSNDARLQELVMAATALSEHDLADLLTVAKSMLGSQRSVPKSGSGN